MIMKRILLLATLLAASASAQVWTNLTAPVQAVFTNWPAETQLRVMETWTNHQRACSNVFYVGVTTNLVPIEGSTNLATVVTTNNIRQTFAVFVRGLLADEAVARRVAALCDRKEAEISAADGRAGRASRAAIAP